MSAAFVIRRPTFGDSGPAANSRGRPRSAAAATSGWSPRSTPTSRLGSTRAIRSPRDPWHSQRRRDPLRQLPGTGSIILPSRQEAFDSDERSIGVYPTPREAANAIPNNEEKKCS
jgi:hypothetical protein